MSRGRRVSTFAARAIAFDRADRSIVPAGPEGERPMAVLSVTLAEAVEGFLLSRRVGNCTARTVDVYAANLWRFVLAVGEPASADCTPVVVQRYLTGLRERLRAVSVHQHFRGLRTFFRWCVATGRLPADPMAGMTMRLPKTLPRVPEDEHIRRLLAACPSTPEGRRNRVMIVLAADAGLRKEELRRLRVAALDFAARTIHVRAGKGQKDGITFFGEVTASLLRAWLAVHPDPRPAAFVLCTRDGSPLGSYTIRRILHRLSRRAGLDRLIGPHALRHYAATAIWRRSGDLELVRRVLRHETLTMTLRYVAVSQADLAAKFATASPMDHLRAAR